MYEKALEYTCTPFVSFWGDEMDKFDNMKQFTIIQRILQTCSGDDLKFIIEVGQTKKPFEKLDLGSLESKSSHYVVES